MLDILSSNYAFFKTLSSNSLPFYHIALNTWIIISLFYCLMLLILKLQTYQHIWPPIIYSLSKNKL